MKRMLRALCWVALVLGMSQALTAQTLHMVAPNTADPLSGAPNWNHFAYTNPAASQQNKLFLFFPGTGGAPINYREIVKHASNIGYHAIGLSYPNDTAINAFCSNVPDSTCHSRARLEVFDGVDRHPTIMVDSLNCIRRRTVKLLQYLEAQYPSEGWGQYYTGDSVIWNKVIVSGHSQGGGHAGIISRIREVSRVVMFAATDWVTPLGQSADWLHWPSLTPSSRVYGFIHETDQYVPFPVQVLTWEDYGIDAYGPLVWVDTTTSPYDESHMLFTRLLPDNDTTQFHGCPVADAYTPMNGNTPVLADVWTYLIGYEPAPLQAMPPVLSSPVIFPNPFQQAVSVQQASAYQDYALYDMQGRMLQQGELVDALQFAELCAGVYILELKGENAIPVRRRLIKEE